MVTLGWLKAGVPKKANKSNSPIAKQPVNNNKESTEFEPKQFDGRIGKIHVRNNTLYEIKVTLWHPDSAAIFNSWVMSGTSKKYLKSNNTAINIGNDWGIQLGDSAIKSIGDAANWKGGEWRVTPQSFFR